MKPTKATNLLITALVSGVAAYLLATYLVSRGQQLPVSGFNVMFTLPVASTLLASFAIPLIRYRREVLQLAKDAKQTVQKTKPQIKRVDPFYAVRIVLLAKAISLASALFIGWHFGLLAIQIAAPELTTGFYKNLGTLIGAVVALVIALVIEWICRIPQGPEETNLKRAGNQIDAALPKSNLNKTGRN